MIYGMKITGLKLIPCGHHKKKLTNIRAGAQSRPKQKGSEDSLNFKTKIAEYVGVGPETTVTSTWINGRNAQAKPPLEDMRGRARVC